MVEVVYFARKQSNHERVPQLARDRDDSFACLSRVVAIWVTICTHDGDLVRGLWQEKYLDVLTVKVVIKVVFIAVSSSVACCRVAPIWFMLRTHHANRLRVAFLKDVHPLACLVCSQTG